MGKTVNSNTTGNARLTYVLGHTKNSTMGQYSIDTDYEELPAHHQAAVDAEYDALVLEAQDRGDHQTNPDLECMGCHTKDPKAFDDGDADYCVTCEEENQVEADEAKREEAKTEEEDKDLE